MITRNRIVNGSVDITKISRGSLMQAGRVTVDATSGTVVAFTVAFDSAPRVVAVGTGASNGTFAVGCINVSAGSFTLYTNAAGTIDWIAAIQPTG